MGFQKTGVCLLAASGSSLRIELIDHGKVTTVCYVSLKDLDAVLHKHKKTATIIKVDQRKEIHLQKYKQV